ncbi:hypothetical protein DIPPA_26069 [Diplonema papillatum]|nr:hypothetical protein DIPPA_26069 [Diplonema papillatum]
MVPATPQPRVGDPGGRRPCAILHSTDSLLLNLKKQNKLQMKSLANTLQLLLSVDAKEKTLA